MGDYRKGLKGISNDDGATERDQERLNKVMELREG